MGNQVRAVDEKIASFRRKYYLNLFLRGTILSLTLVLAYLLLASLLEYNLWMGKGLRLLLFVFFFAVVTYCLLRFLREPITWWLSGRGLGKEQSAKMIGGFFPEIQDRLLNFLQLAAFKENRTALLEASLEQKAGVFERFSFESIIDLKANRQYLKYLFIPIGIAVVIFIANQNIFTQGAQRIIHFNQEYSPQAPFSFILRNPSLVSYPNEDFTLEIGLEGEAVPASSYLIIGQRRMKMESIDPGNFSYTFEKIQQEQTFQIEAAGFLSPSYTIKVVNRPELLQLKVQLQFPRYIGRHAEELSNTGALEVPEGSRISWSVGTAFTDKAIIQFQSQSSPNQMQLSDNHTFEFGKTFYNPDEYSIVLKNESSQNKDAISYRIDVIKDQHPTVVVDHLKDSVLFKAILLAGSIQDDYGISKLELHYQLNRTDKRETSGTIPIPTDSPSAQQNFFFNWAIDSLRLNAGDRLQYFVEVWDNDGVHGSKSSRSSSYQFVLPGSEEFKAEIRKSQNSTQSEIENSITKAKSLKESIEQAEQKLRGKQTLDWQDKKMLEDLIQQKRGLDQLVEQLKEQNKLLEEKKDAYSEQNERIREKAEQIQKLMNELLDEDTRKLFEELEKMLKENQDPSQIQKMLDKMDRQEINIEKELERTLELFKQLQYDYKLDQAVQEIKEQIEKQEDILDQTQELAGEKKEEKPADKEEKGQKGEKGDKSEKGDKQSGSEQDSKAPADQEELAAEQEELTQKADEFKKTLEELDKLGDELDQPESTPDTKEVEEMKEFQNQSKESLKQGQPKKATAPQKKSLEKMQQMKQQLEGMQSSMEMEMDQQNLESLRQIIHGLIKLSFDQEGLMKEFNTIPQSDPRYIQLSQNQLKVQDDSKVLEDSLLALSKKDPFMGSIVTKEIGELDLHLDKAVENIKERKKSNASTDMQLAMTSINNLALLLNDHFDMMMDMMANASPSGKKDKKNKGQKSLGEMQQQLNQQIEKMKNSGKGGRELSEELARMAAEQERIRRALNEMQEKLKKEGGKPLGNDIPGKMEQTELDLVNKQITEQTIRRQKEILTRLLESEKSMREQELDEERKGETAKEYEKQVPKAFEDYLRLKEKEVELLKTMPPKLYPYYKKEVNEYFKRLGTKN